MPSVSPAPHRLMEAAAHTKGGYGGVPQKVGEEFDTADNAEEAEGHMKAEDHHATLAEHHKAMGEQHEEMAALHREKLARLLQRPASM